MQVDAVKVGLCLGAMSKLPIATQALKHHSWPRGWAAGRGWGAVGGWYGKRTASSVGALDRRLLTVVIGGGG